MWEFLRSTPAQAVLWVAVLFILSAIGVYLVKFFRNRADGGISSAHEMLSRFRDMQDDGQLSTHEFRRVRSVLAPRLDAELKSKDAERED